MGSRPRGFMPVDGFLCASKEGTGMTRKAAYTVDRGKLIAIAEMNRMDTDDIARKSGISLDTVVRLMSGRHSYNMRTKTVYRLADALGCEPSAFAARV